MKSDIRQKHRRNATTGARHETMITELRRRDRIGEASAREVGNQNQEVR